MALPVLLGLALVGLPACTAAATFDGTLYRGRDVAFRVPAPPPAWQRVSIASSDLAFRDEAHDASILINSRCAASDRDAPLLVLTQHLIIGTTDRHVTREETLPFDGREARHTVLEARLDGVPMSYDIFVLKKDACVFDLVYVTVPGAPSSGAAEFDAFVHGFHTVPGPG